MEKMPSNYRKMPRKRVIAKGSLFLFLLLAAGTLLFLSGSISVLVGLLWLGGILSFFIMLAGMNEDINHDEAPRKVVMLSTYMERKRISNPRVFSPHYNE